MYQRVEICTAMCVLVIVWTRVQLTINSRVVSTKTSKLSESVGRGTI